MSQGLGKDVALSLGLLYKEFPPKHVHHNQYCVLPADQYNRPYQVSNFFERNSQIADYCDHLIAFIVKGVKANGTWDTVTKATKAGKRVFVFEDE